MAKSKPFESFRRLQETATAKSGTFNRRQTIQMLDDWGYGIEDLPTRERHRRIYALPNSVDGKQTAAIAFLSFDQFKVLCPYDGSQKISEDVVPFPTNRWVGSTQPKVMTMQTPAAPERKLWQKIVDHLNAGGRILLKSYTRPTIYDKRHVAMFHPPKRPTERGVYIGWEGRKKVYADPSHIAFVEGSKEEPAQNQHFVNPAAVPDVVAPAAASARGFDAAKLKKLVDDANRIIEVARRMYHEKEVAKDPKYFPWAADMSAEEVVDRLMEINKNDFIRIKAPGKKFVNLDFGSSGRFMVAYVDIPEKHTAAGDIKHIKAYGVPHYGYAPVGNVATVLPSALADAATRGWYGREIKAAAAKLGLH